MADDYTPRLLEAYYTVENVEEHQDAILAALRDNWFDEALNDVGVNSSGNVYVHVWADAEDMTLDEGKRSLWEHFGGTIEQTDGVDPSDVSPHMAQFVGRDEDRRAFGVITPDGIGLVQTDN